jgi:hypothetical protein
MPPSGSDASIATGGGGESGSMDSQSTGGQGAASSAGSSGQAGVHSSGASSQGGVIASAGASSLGSVSSSAGGSAGGSNSLGGVTASAGNRTSSAGGGGRGGAGSGGTASQGGVSSLAGSGGWGGSSSLGGSKSSGGSSGGKTATVVPPREPTSHRPKAPSCVFLRRAEPINATDAGVVPDGNCKKHADCVTRPNGECVNISDFGLGRRMPPYYSCIYTLCGTDADCTENELCDCRDGQPGTCVGRGNCRVDDDCGGGATSYCSRAYGYDCGGYHALGSYYCHTPKDTCITDADCTGKDYCDYEVITGRWECKSPNLSCVIG